jgi:hypothetical protein
VSSWCIDIDVGYVNMDPDIQRDYVWDEDQKQNFIKDLLLQNRYNLPTDIGLIKYNKRGAEYRLINGKQRSRTMHDFKNNVFPVILKNGNRYYYSEIPEKDPEANVLPFITRRFFDTYPIMLIEYKNLTNEEEGYVFESTNRASALRIAEKMHAIVSPLQLQLEREIYPALRVFLTQFNIANKRRQQDRLLLPMVQLFNIQFDMTRYRFWDEKKSRQFLLDETIKIDSAKIVKFYTKFFKTLKQHFESIVIESSSGKKKAKVSYFIIVDFLLLYVKYKNQPNFLEKLKTVCTFVSGKNKSNASLMQVKYRNETNVAFGPTRIKKRIKILENIYNTTDVDAVPPMVRSGRQDSKRKTLAVLLREKGTPLKKRKTKVI